MVSINTNLQSIIVQKNLTQSSNSLNKAIERLTTGFKINHASDNAANYSITENMSSKLSSYMVAEENTSMGLDLIQTQSATLETIQNLTTRLRALAEQAHNGTYGSQSLEAINQEAEAITQEITRIAQNAEYNGINLFENASTKYGLSKASNSGFIKAIEHRDTSGMTSIASVNENETLTAGTYSISTAEELAKFSQMSFNGKTAYFDIEVVLANDIDLSAYSGGEGWTPIESFNGTFDGNGYTISNLKINREDEDYQALFATMAGTVKNLNVINADVKGNGYVAVLVAQNYGQIDNVSVQGNLFAKSSRCGEIAAVLGNTGSVDSCSSSGNLYSKGCVGGLVGDSFSGASGIVKNSFTTCSVSGWLDNVGGLMGRINGSVKIQNCYSSGKVNGAGDYGAFVGCILEDVVAIESSNYDSTVNKDMKGVGASTSEDIDLIDIGSLLHVGINSGDTSQIRFSTNFSLSEVSGLLSNGLESTSSLAKIDAFINKLSDYQTTLGAIENRLMSNIESIGVNIENLTSFRSTLKDADVAKESSNYIRSQILQQASATLLATANQTPELTLRLLGALQV